MEEIKNRVFYRRAVKFGNSSGVLLPKSLLGAEVKVLILNPPVNIKKDVLNIIGDILDNIIGIYVISVEKRKVEVLVVSNSILRTIETGNYHLDIIPLNILKKSLKEKIETKLKIKNAKPIMNKMLLFELKKSIGA